LQLEALAQAGALAILADERYADSLPLFGGVEGTRFRRVVRPGDELVLTVEMEQLSARGGWGVGQATVEGQRTCDARLFFAISRP
jgi:3-hydroxyacyl-[acyl-carrier-protein] dehydratase